MTPRCGCRCHTGRVARYLGSPAVTDPVAALSCCSLCAATHAGVWTVYARPRVVKRWEYPQADGCTDSEGPE